MGGCRDSYEKWETVGTVVRKWETVATVVRK